MRRFSIVGRPIDRSHVENVAKSGPKIARRSIDRWLRSNFRFDRRGGKGEGKIS